MGDVIIDIVEGAVSSHSLFGGWTATRVAIVSGLNLDGALSTASLMRAAEDNVIAITGCRGTLYDGFGPNTYVDHFETEVLAATVVKVKVVYRGYPVPVLSFDSSLNMVKSNLDNAGNAIVLSYTYPADYPLDVMKRGKACSQGGFVMRPNPEALFTVRWIIAAGAEVPPDPLGTPSTKALTALKEAYEGKVNDGVYTIGTLAGAARTWLIEKITGHSNDYGLSYDATMTFHYKPNTWDQLAVYMNPDDGMPPHDLVDGVGYKFAKTFPEVTFPAWSSFVSPWN